LPKVLIIESDEDARYLYDIALRFQNLTVETANTVKDGLRLVPQLKPELLLLDQLVPDLDNHNVINELEKVVPHKMPIIIATNLRDKSHADRDELQILKAFAYLTSGEFTVGDVIRTSRKAAKI